MLDHRILEARDARLETIRDHYAHRRDRRRAAHPRTTRRPTAVPPERLYLTELAWDNLLAERQKLELFAVRRGTVRRGHGARRRRPPGPRLQRRAPARRHQPVRRGRAPTSPRARPTNSGSLVAGLTVGQPQPAGPPAAGASRRRGRDDCDLARAPRGSPADTRADCGPGAGARLRDPGSRRRHRTGHPGRSHRAGPRASGPARDAERFLSEASQLAEGDYVVHVEHGIGRFDGLQTLDAGRRAARLPAPASTTATTSCSCRSRTSTCCRATAPTTPRPARPPGQRELAVAGAPASRSASPRWRATCSRSPPSAS